MLNLAELEAYCGEWGTVAVAVALKREGGRNNGVVPYANISTFAG